MRYTALCCAALMLCLSGAAIAATITVTPIVSQGTLADPGESVLGMTGAANTIVIPKHPAWADSIAGSQWISYIYQTGDPGGTNWYEVPNNTVVHFAQSFFLPGTPLGGSLTVMADDSASVYVNGTMIYAEAPPNGYPTCSSTPIGCLESTRLTLSIPANLLSAGANKVDFYVAQRANVAFGLDYAGSVESSAVPEPGTAYFIVAGIAGIAIGRFRRRR